MSNPINNTEGENVFTLQILRRAWVKVVQHAKLDATYYDSFGFEDYARHLEANLIMLNERLGTREYRFQPLHNISVPKSAKNDTTQIKAVRDLYYPAAETGIVLQAICDIISPSLEQLIPSVSYGNRVVVDDPDANRIFHSWQQSYGRFGRSVQDYAEAFPDAWYHKTDITKFYPRINKSLLLDKIRQVVPNPQILSLLEMFFEIEAVQENGLLVEVQGIPAGVPLSHVLANVYLRELDVFMVNRTAAYFRYVDDVIFFDEDEVAVSNSQSIFETRLLTVEQLEVNREKSATYPAADKEILTSILSEISDTLRLSLSTQISAQQKIELGTALYDILVAAEDIDDPAAVAKYAALVIRRLQFLGFKEDLSSIAYKFLDAAPLRPNAIRTLISYLVQQNINGPSARFLQFIEDAYSYIKIVFLQTIRTYAAIDAAIWPTVIKFMSDESIFVQGEAAITLTRDGISFDSMGFQEAFKKLTDSTAPNYLRIRVLNLATFIQGPTNHYLHDFLISNEQALINAALSQLERHITASQRFLSSEEQRGIPQEPTITANYTYLILRMISLETGEEVKNQLIESLAGFLWPLSSNHWC